MTITPRNLNFDFSSMGRPWIKNNSYLAHMFDAPSFVLPYMEGLVNYAVKQCLDKISNEKLQADCLNFVCQETHHAREHIKYNQQLNQHGYRVDLIIKPLRANLTYIKKKWSLLSVLAVGVGFECLTAIISQTVIEDQVLADADEEIKRFWSWHMMEELEHRSVLFDLYQALGGSYWRCAGIYTLVLLGYCYYSLRIYLRLIKKDKASMVKGLFFACNKKSFFRKSLVRSLKFYRFNYHPNIA